MMGCRVPTQRKVSGALGRFHQLGAVKVPAPTGWQLAVIDSVSTGCKSVHQNPLRSGRQLTDL